MFKKTNQTKNTKNTLLNYFSRTPEPNKEKSKSILKEQIDNPSKVKEEPASTTPLEDDAATKPKKRRISFKEDSIEEDQENDSSLFEGGDSDEYVPSGEESQSDSSNADNSASESEGGSGSGSGSDNDSPVKSRNKRSLKKSKSSGESPKVKKAKMDRSIAGKTFIEKLENLKSNPESIEKNVAKKVANIVGYQIVETTIWPHQKLDFLLPENVCDKKKRRPDHPDYDPNTLYVPESYIAKQSPGHRQWWKMKSENFQCVLFFKVGKFYELYHMDADVGVQELGFTYMKGDFAHSGFPEVSYDKMSSILIDRGYKVARVEQTETPDMMEERRRQSVPSKVEKKADKVVKREICQISSRGTQIYSAQCQINPSYCPNYMMAIVEKIENSLVRYGICFIDTSIGDCYLSEFDDDENNSRLLTLISQNKPVLILYENHSLSANTMKILNTILCSVMKEVLPSSKNYDAKKTMQHLAEHYFGTSEQAVEWPDVLKNMSNIEDMDITPKAKYLNVLKALGLVTAHLNRCKLEEKVIPMARYHLYVPPDMQFDSESKNSVSEVVDKPANTSMVLDAATIANLRIIGDENSLFAVLNHCCTKFGQRLLHNWLCAPSCNVGEIKDRQMAISDLLNHSNKMDKIRSILVTMPDFDRYLAQIQVFGSKNVMENHPDGRAILFEEKQYNRKKIKNFTSILHGFQKFLELSLELRGLESELIRNLTQTEALGGKFPDMVDILDFFKNSFDHEDAEKTGVILLKKGIDKDLDRCELKVKEINDELKKYLSQQEKLLGCSLSYFGNDKKRFQIEVPENYVKNVGSNYSLESQKKGKNPVRRYVTNETKEFLRQMIEAEEERSVVLRDISRRIFEKFSSHYNIWKKAVDCIAYLDVLLSLAEYTRNQSVTCIPDVTDFNEKPYVRIEEGYHPGVKKGSYIPNDITLGTDATAPLSLLTGPNMGGKSTLMRKLGCLIIMAQLGAHVPAKSCSLSVVDRIFTRLGAQDDILAAQSTFLVELNETNLILKHASKHSLVLLDELGRGTATYDGTAIAAAVVSFLVNLKCRTLFSTHYHSLTEYYHKHEGVYLGHMACMVENDDIDDPTEENVIFLYKYSPGSCPKSYGFNAAKLAGLEDSIVKRSYQLCKQVEKAALKRKIIAKIIKDADISLIKDLCLKLKSSKL